MNRSTWLTAPLLVISLSAYGMKQELDLHNIATMQRSLSPSHYQNILKLMANQAQDDLSKSNDPVVTATSQTVVDLLSTNENRSAQWVSKARAIMAKLQPENVSSNPLIIAPQLMHLIVLLPSAYSHLQQDEINLLLGSCTGLFSWTLDGPENADNAPFEILRPLCAMVVKTLDFQTQKHTNPQKDANWERVRQTYQKTVSQPPSPTAPDKEEEEEEKALMAATGLSDLLNE